MFLEIKKDKNAIFVLVNLGFLYEIMVFVLLFVFTKKVLFR